jgi:hypothetical protein
MTAISITPGYPTFADTDGSPLNDGYVYIGLENQDPITAPTGAFWDKAFQVPADQPLRTSGGYIVRNGTPAAVYTGASYSILVQNKNLVTVYNAPSAVITNVTNNVEEITQYQGAHATDPIARNDGTPLEVGDLYFNTVINELKVWTGTDWVPASPGAITVQNFTGTGAQTGFNLATAPVAENNTQIYIDGVYQQKDTYTVAGATINFSTAPPYLSGIEVVTFSIAALGTVDASNVSYNEGSLGAVNTSVQAKLQESVSVKDFGAVGDGVADDTLAIQAAIDAASRIYFPEGDYKITDQAGGYALLISAGNKHLVGAGLEVANLVYTSSAINRPAIKVTASDVHFESLRIDGTANATKAAQTRANCDGIDFLNVSECSVRFCQIIGGHYGIYFDNDTALYDNNDHNIAEGNILRNFQSTGLIAHKAQYLLVQGNDAQDCKNDGFKISEGTQFSRILGNTSRNNDRDGFDVYSGFIESVLDGNVAEDNQLQGYEIKGTFGVDDYVVRNSVISNNVATRNGLGGTHPGFSIISVRNCTFDGNISVSNTGSGFDFNTVQGCTVTGCLATRNTQHGFDLSANVSRTQFSGCQSVDNSWVDGTIQNGAYHGYNLKSASTGQFVGCMSMNGTTTGKKGGQGYGWFWPTAISGSRLQNCYTLANVTGGFGGGTGWASANGFFNVTDNGTLKGIQFTDDALSTMSMTGAFNEMAIIDGITEPTTVSGKTFIYVDTADGDLKVKFGDGTVKTISTDT